MTVCRCDKYSNHVQNRPVFNIKYTSLTRLFCLQQVEEARKKMFNGTISSVPQTFTVVTPQLNSQSSTNPSAASKPLQSAASVLPCQLLGQTSLVLTPVANGSTVTCAPLALTVANQVQNPRQRCDSSRHKNTHNNSGLKPNISCGSLEVFSTWTVKRRMLVRNPSSCGKMGAWIPLFSINTFNPPVNLVELFHWLKIGHWTGQFVCVNLALSLN